MIVDNPRGLSFSFSDVGVLARIDVGPVCISATASAAFAQSVTNLFLRKRGDGGAFTPLLGPDSPSGFRTTRHGFDAAGHWAGLDYACRLRLSKSRLAWQWQVRIESRLDQEIELDLLYVQHISLKAKGAGLLNPHYVGQYLERRVLEDAAHGSVVCCRQNMREAGGHPWLMIACANRAVAASTDGHQFYGTTFRATGVPEALRASTLQGELSGEDAVVALQEQPFSLAGGGTHSGSFVAQYAHDHPQPSSEADLAQLAHLGRGFARRARSSVGAFALPARDRLRDARFLPAEDLNPAELTDLFGAEWRHIERAGGELLSFFAEGPRHVVLRAKEMRVLRPHGHIMQAQAGGASDERIMSTTAFAGGVFNAHLTQGNTNFNTLLSVCTHPAQPERSGQRIIVQSHGESHLLGVPSAFEMGLNHCRWIYKWGEHVLQVCTWAASNAPHIHLAVKVLRGGPVRLTLTHEFDDLNRWTVAPGAAREFIAKPRAGSTIAKKFPHAQFRMLVHGEAPGHSAHARAASRRAGKRSAAAPFVLDVPAATAFCMSFVGEVPEPARSPRILDADAQRKTDCASAAAAWQARSGGLSLRGASAISAVDTILPWYEGNARVHYRTPYGLEQFSGAAWGTRDVCQGPMELLLCQENFAEAKQVLRLLFAHQNPDGTWPQWWMFDRYKEVRADSAHGDVVYWCVLALCAYVRASGDLAFLDEKLPYCCLEGAEQVPAEAVSSHIDRIVQWAVSSFVPGTALVQFGGGDWNDSLQPVSEELARRMISSWTVQMAYQALQEYGGLCERAGKTAQAMALAELCARIHADFHRHLMKDGVVAGYGLVCPDKTIEVLLHPNDTRTGVHHSLLPMNRGVISGMFSQDEAERHMRLVTVHLTGPDGARLMDRPLRYRGGLQTLFQRAESSCYFGREIGLMYVHEHLRYAEALARMGRADDFLHALRQAIPVEYQDVVPQGDLRQANCYYSSSDVLFKSRYEADARYADVVVGKLPLTGGWRVYSSGPGIYIAHVVTRLLGLRVAFDELIVDPVLARSLDGLRATLQFRGHAVTFAYRVAGAGFGPQSLVVNGKAAEFEREDNPYRVGGAVMPVARILALLDAGENTVDVTV
jgi:cellobiose phosphorylase